MELQNTTMDPMQSEESVSLTRNGVTPRFGSLRHGNTPMDPRLLRLAPRCTARRKHDKQPCGNPAVNGYSVCRMHGGKSKGPTTAEGLERCRKAAWKHGKRSVEHREYRREIRAWIAYFNAELKVIARELRPILRARRQQNRQELIVGCATLEGGFDLAAVLRP